MGSISDTPPQTRQRKRKVHTKVKSGCQTCKIRRKKCDETRPFCQRCTSTGRKCDGYIDTVKPEEIAPTSSRKWDWQQCAQFPTWQARSTPTFDPTADDCWRHCTCPPGATVDHTVACLMSCPLYTKMPPPLQLASEVEYLCFDFFRYKTGPGFAGYFDSSIWSSLILEACFNEPVVLQAVTALGAVHRRYELGISPEAFRWCEISDRLYRKALRNWNKQLKEGTADTRPEIYMVLAKLFGTFEAFQDNPEIATKYMMSSFMHLLGQPVNPVLSERQPVNVTLNQTTLRQFFLKLQHQAAYLFGHSTDVIWANVWKYETGFEMPTAFKTIEEARDCLFAEVRQIWNIPYSTSIPVEDLNTMQRNYLGRLMQWSAAYGEYAQIHRPTNDRLLKRIGRLMKWYREAAFLQLLLQTTPGSPIDDQMIVSCDGSRQFLANTFNKAHCTRKTSLVAHFARLSLLSDGVLSEQVQFGTTALQYGSSTGMGLHLGSASCRSSDIRTQMAALMGPFLGQDDKKWDSLGLYTVAEKVSSFEERAVEAAADLQRTDENRANWVDITYFMESRMNCIVYCQEQEGTDAFVWCRDWYRVDGSGNTSCPSILHS